MSKNYTVARINIDGKTFELLVKPEPALSYREGKPVSLSDILVTDTVYSDANKGLRVSDEDLKHAFGTLDIQKIAQTILRKGTLLLTSEQRRRMIEDVKKQIIAFISRNAVDPKTKLPHPPTRIEQALEQIHFSVDPFKSVEEQANEAIKLLRSILPLSVEKITISVKIPAQYAGRAYGAVKSFGTVKSESWLSDGSWSATVEMAAGFYGPFLEKIGEISKGTLEVKILK
ncbi:MAG: ribosome assembly factor SBDS [Nitrososphaerota archaeon]|nr:ribosome assembly factor SBDS [Candidatus Bathyarchaeota archaeon]MDW8048812.1 ribosome assembly factor SBDS [Nitrososphaerota archaeon]